MIPHQTAHPLPHVECHLEDEAATLHFGASLSHTLRRGMVIYLYGDLGAGKTTLVRGILRGFGYAHAVKSPTYQLVEAYNVFNLNLYHFDLYRFNNALEWEESGFGDYCGAESLCLIEWPEKGLPLLPPADVHIHLNAQDDGRHMRAVAFTPLGAQCVKKLQIQIC
jgi:tRNA threonylcarbamoyladenosine biosynthesis protein TsaE